MSGESLVGDRGLVLFFNSFLDLINLLQRVFLVKIIFVEWLVLIQSNGHFVDFFEDFRIFFGKRKIVLLIAHFGQFQVAADKATYVILLDGFSV